MTIRPRNQIDLENYPIPEVSEEYDAVVYKKLEDGSIVPAEHKNKYIVLEREEEQPKVVGVHSKNYSLIKNEYFIEAITDVLGDKFEGFVVDEDKWMHVYCYEADKKMFPNTDDELQLGLRMSNSYDGSSALKIAVVAIREVCSNGMFSEGLLGQSYQRHTNASIEQFKTDLEKFYEQDFKMLQDIYEGAKEWIVAEPKELITAFSFKWGNGVPANLIEKVIEDYNRLSDEKDEWSRWDIYNIFTRRITHGYSRREGVLQTCATYSEQYLQRIHNHVNDILILTDEEISRLYKQYLKIQEQVNEAQKAQESSANGITVIAEP